MSRTTERRRHEALARETASWQSWIVGDWFTNRNMAVMLDERSTGRDMRLDFECMCDLTRRRTHELDLTRHCVFVDSYEPDQNVRTMLAKSLKLSSEHRGNRFAVIDRDVELESTQGIVCYRVRIPGETDPRAWLAVQKAYVEAIERHARPDRWAWFRLPPAPDGRIRQPAVWALRGDRGLGVGLISPLTCPGSAIEVAPEPAAVSEATA